MPCLEAALDCLQMYMRAHPSARCCKSCLPRTRPSWGCKLRSAAGKFTSHTLCATLSTFSTFSHLPGLSAHARFLSSRPQCGFRSGSLEVRLPFPDSRASSGLLQPACVTPDSGAVQRPRKHYRPKSEIGTHLARRGRHARNQILESETIGNAGCPARAQGSEKRLHPYPA